MNSDALAALRSRFGAQVSTAQAVLDAHGRDESHPTVHPPHAVLHAQSEQDVADALRLASAHGFPVTPFAVGSSLEGQVIPVQGGLSLDVSGMKEVLAIDAASFQATVQPGVTYPELNRQARRHGLFFPVDPGAEASLGGMASTNASGTAAVRYGTTRENVLELRAALMSGEVVRLGSRARKTSAGYDLKDLLIGAEGTLGVITELTVRLWPLPEHVATLRVTFPSVQAVADCAVAIMGAALQPERLELLDEEGLRAVNAHLGREYPVRPTLWAELAAPTPAALDAALALCADLCRDAGGEDLQTARTPAERAEVWEARHKLYYAVSALFPAHTRLNTDLCVPLAQLPAVLGEARRLCDERGLDGCFVGHVGDGNFHILFHAPLDDAGTWASIHATYDELVALALGVGGTCTGEHGVGLHKRAHLAREHAGSLGLMRQVKAAFDPQGLLNPGKLF